MVDLLAILDTHKAKMVAGFSTKVTAQSLSDGPGR